MKRWTAFFILITFLFVNVGVAYGQSDEALRDKISNMITKELSGKNFDLLITERLKKEWVIYGMDAKLAKSIDKAVEDIINDSSYIRKLLSGYLPNTAKTVANEILKRALDSPEMNNTFVKVIVATYSGIIEDVLMEKYLDIFTEIGEDIKARYGKDIARKFVKYVADLIEKRGASASDLLGNKELIKSFAMQYDMVKITIFTTIAILVADRIIRLVVSRVGSQSVARITPRFVRAIFSNIFSRLLPKLVRLSGVLSIVLTVWDLTHVNDNIRKIGDRIIASEHKISEELFVVIRDEMKRQFEKATKEAALQVADSFLKIYEDFKIREGVR